ncbi:hypothetical protein [Dysgonomonas sp. BGC7]|uniref:hypothetical protein n=1 Tax=Dysgonomonas sp. BGC7 TaxID=1658008 RepID=UPI0006825148|nr:hypothetical protein [Dysgonomonas sp. BGC7]MBD8388807.1 hypothetical protein [Dysgonomonas sp. BGC7]
MKRFYSHYTFIYPDTYLKNNVVELDSENKIVRYFPFCREIEKTEFYSGLLIFYPGNINITENLKTQIYSYFEISKRETDTNIFAFYE